MDGKRMREIPPQRKIRRRPSPRWKVADSVLYILARDEYLQKAGILTKTGERSWYLKV